VRLLTNAVRVLPVWRFSPPLPTAACPPFLPIRHPHTAIHLSAVGRAVQGGAGVLGVVGEDDVTFRASRQRYWNGVVGWLDKSGVARGMSKWD